MKRHSTTRTALKAMRPLRAPSLTLILVLQALTPSGCTPDEASNGVSVAGARGEEVPEDTPPRSPPLPQFPTDPLVPTDAPVLIPGSGGIGGNGQSSYGVPLRAPAGPGGMRPELTLNYGGGSNGRLGVGWQVSGLSAITPCPQTVASEGVADGVDFDDTDSYCLDGVKLVRDIAEGYGTHRRLRTEVESHARIFADYASAESPQPYQFTVETRDGRVLTYEPLMANRLQLFDGEADAEVERQVAPVFPIMEAVDVTGENRVVYNYDLNSDSNVSLHEFSFRVSRIEWSFNAQTQARRHLDFVYEEATRPDPIVSFSSGVRSASRHRLVAIEAHAPNPTATELVWIYHLTYGLSPQTGRSRLTNIKLCDQGNICSWNKEIGWTNQTLAIKQEHVVSSSSEFSAEALSQDASSWLAYTTIPSRNFYPPSDVRLVVLDVDNDGIDDVLYRTQDTRFEGDPALYPAYPDFEYHPGSIFLRRSQPGAPLANRDDVTGLLEPNSPTLWQAHLGKSRVADLDADGDQDLLLARTRVSGVEPILDLYQTWFGVLGGDPYYGEWDFGYQPFDSYPWTTADAGALEQRSVHGGVFRENPTGYQSYHLFTPAFQRTLADLDGDGRIDHVDAFLPTTNGLPLELTGYETVDWANYHSKDLSLPYWYDIGGVRWRFDHDWSCSNGNIAVSDFNGDGRTEVLAATDLEVDVGFQLFKQMGLQDRLPGSPPADSIVEGTAKLLSGDCIQYLDLVFGDFNGDGLTDALYPPGSYGSNTVAYVRFNHGNGFGQLENFPVQGPPGMTDLLVQPVPVGKDQRPIGWDRGTRVADVDEDGRADIVAFRLDASGCVDPNANYLCSTFNTVVAVYLSRGDHFEAQVLHTWTGSGVNLASGFTTAKLGDVTGDGYTDVLHVTSDGRLRVLELHMADRATDRLAWVRDMGSSFKSLEFEYSRAWWGDDAIHSPSTSCTWPTVCPRRGFTVANEERTFGGTDAQGNPMYRTRTHAFEDPQVDLQGRGFLGFAQHRMWDRELGRQTSTTRDLVRIDPDPNSPGGIFYVPGALGITAKTVIPLRPQPTAAELAVATMAPGLLGTPADPLPQIEVRVEETVNTEQVQSSVYGRVISVLPSGYTSKEWETTGQVNGDAHVPGYLMPSGTIYRERSGTFVFDSAANLTEQIHETTGGVRQVTRATYENRTGTQWLLGLQTSSEATAYSPGNIAPGDPTTPKIISSSVYNSVGLLETLTRSARPSMASLCPSTDPTFCDIVSTVTSFSYDARGNLLGHTSVAPDEALPRTVGYEFDQEGIYVRRMTDALGNTYVTLRHPALGVTVLEQDPLGIITTHKVDGFGRVREVNRPGLPTLNRSYAEHFEGPRVLLRTHDTSGDNGESATEYDELGRAVLRTTRGSDGQMLVRTFEFNALGTLAVAHRPGINFPAPYVSKFAFDRLGRPIETITPEGAVTTIEHALFESTTTDPEGHVSYAKTDLDGRLIESGHVVNGVPYGEIQFFHGAYGQVERTLDADGNQTFLHHDAFGRRTLLDEPDTGATTYSYNGFGQLVTETANNGDTTSYTYDAIGRVLSASGADGITAYTWDSGPNATLKLVGITSPDGVVTTNEYNALGRKRQIRKVIENQPYIVDLTYDSLGRLDRVLYPEAPGHARFAIQHHYDSRGFPLSIDDISACNTGLSATGEVISSDCPPNTPKTLWTALARDRDNAVSEALLGSGDTITRLRDAATGRLASLQVTTSPAYSQSYHYFDDGNLERRTYADGTADVFEYDDLHRLDGWSVHEGYDPERPGTPTFLQQYDYDELGNLEMVTRGAQVMFSATYGVAGRPHAIDSSNTVVAFAYDPRGRQTGDGARTITYSQYDLPSAITGPSGTSSFKYDGWGARAFKRVQSAGSVKETTYVDSLYERRVVDDVETHVYTVQAETGPVAQVERTLGGDDTKYLVTDVLGSIVLVLDASGAVVEESRYAPFGGRVDAQGLPVQDPDMLTTLGFTGHEHDHELDLVNMRGRIYDRSQYRFLSPDPVLAAPSFGQSHNPYSYVLNNPLRYSDPSGFQTVPSDGPPAPSSAPVPPEPATQRYEGESCGESATGRSCTSWSLDYGVPATTSSDRPEGEASGSPAPAPSPEAGGGVGTPSGDGPVEVDNELAVVAQAAAIMARNLTRMKSEEMAAVADAMADLDAWYVSRGEVLKHGLSERWSTFALLEVRDGAGYKYILTANGRGVAARIRSDLAKVIPDIKIGGSYFDAAGNLVDAEINAVMTADDLGGEALRGVISKFSCDACTARWAKEGIENLTGAAADHGGKVTRPRIVDAIDAAKDVGRLSGVRSWARVLTPVLEGIAAPLGAFSFGMNMADGRQADAVLGDLTGVAGSIVALTGGNPFVAGGLGAFSAGYGVTMGVLESQIGEVPPLNWDDIHF